jgi:uncharacterized protein YutE (UPF0331/DUF86 family)
LHRYNELDISRCEEFITEREADLEDVVGLCRLNQVDP